MNKAYTVSQVNEYIKSMFTQDFMLRKISVDGEVSNLKYHSSGHIYFSLKDASGTLSCVMFASQRKGLAFKMKDGDNVIATGSVNVYERDGRYQLYANDIKLAGAGVLYEKFLALKKELEEMGMFDDSYKRPIPYFAKSIGIVTAATGAAVQDIRKVAFRRNPYVQLILFPAKVQGDGAAKSIVSGIEQLDRMGVDVIIVGRGGGSIEDLWAFNEEIVAKAIFDCETPIISAVGHETDTTIADFVADRRAPTPSAAAELATLDLSGVLSQLVDIRRRFRFSMESRIDTLRRRIESYEKNLSYLSPEHRVLEKRQQLIDTEDRLRERFERILMRKKHTLEMYLEKFKGLSPLDKLGQGFSYVEDGTGRAVTKLSDVQIEDRLNIQVTDGEITVQVEDKKQIKRG